MDVFVDQISAGYRDKTILHNVSFEILSGTITSIIGPNGSGKSTLLKALCNLIPTTGGKIIYGNDELKLLNQKQVARSVALIPQFEEPIFEFSVKQTILMGRNPWDDVNFDIVNRITDNLNLTHLSNRVFSTLSGGERQRVLLARALAQDTPVILMDEPTAHMDIGYQLATINIIRKLTDEGKTVCIVLHDLNLATAVSDNSILMFDGRIILKEKTEDIIHSAELEQVYGTKFSKLTDSLSGRTFVTADILNVHTKSESPKRIHMIGGGGSAAPLMSHLWQLGHKLSIGVTHIGDSDQEMATKLGIPSVSANPFEPINLLHTNKATDIAKNCDLLIVCKTPFSTGNLENLKFASRMLAEGKPVILIKQNDDWDFTEGMATEIRTDLLSSGASEVTEFEIIQVVNELGAS